MPDGSCLRLTVPGRLHRMVTVSGGPGDDHSHDDGVEGGGSRSRNDCDTPGRHDPAGDRLRAPDLGRRQGAGPGAVHARPRDAADLAGAAVGGPPRGAGRLGQPDDISPHGARGVAGLRPPRRRPGISPRPHRRLPARVPGGGLRHGPRPRPHPIPRRHRSPPGVRGRDRGPLPLRSLLADGVPRGEHVCRGAGRPPAVRRLRSGQDHRRNRNRCSLEARRAREDGDVEGRYAELRRILDEIGPCFVAFSGGVDSTFLLRAAHDRLGEGVVAVTAVSPSLPTAEREEAIALARSIGARHLLVETHEMEDSAYVRNDASRCYHCKRELFGVLRRVAAEAGRRPVIYGAITDDLGEDRPGMRAAAETSVRAPLIEAGLTKGMVRALSKSLGLPTWDKPSMACLASRIPRATPVTAEVLALVERAEAALKAL